MQASWCYKPDFLALVIIVIVAMMPTISVIDGSKEVAEGPIGDKLPLPASDRVREAEVNAFINARIHYIASRIRKAIVRPRLLNGLSVTRGEREGQVIRPKEKCKCTGCAALAAATAGEPEAPRPPQM
jgi:hypothetical protein